MVSRYEKWEVGDYMKHFLTEAKKTKDKLFKDKFNALGENLEHLDVEFMRENGRCGAELGELMGDLHGIAARLGYCETERGYEGECRRLYADVDAAIEKTGHLEERCFI
ncbi:MAG: hypothetical protein C0609_02690 [Deltaproteobacteria bacterium]|nr:MAG: hypothetical protein C0609_02690 [Deltaproteobacteria bacterium]